MLTVTTIITFTPYAFVFVWLNNHNDRDTELEKRHFMPQIMKKKFPQFNLSKIQDVSKITNWDQIPQFYMTHLETV